MSQLDKLYNLLYDGKPHRTDEIVREVYGPNCVLARIGARIHDLKRSGHVIKGWADKNHKLYWYQMDVPKAVEIPKDLFSYANIA